MIYVLIPTTPDRRLRLEKTIESIKKSVCDQEISIKIDCNDYEGFVKPFLRLVNAHDGLAFFVGDDTVVYSDTIQRLYNSYVGKFPNNDGMCAPDDGFSDYNCVATAPFSHTKVFREVVYPGYFHNFVDREWSEIMIMREKYLAVPEAKVSSAHYNRNPKMMDKTYEVAALRNEEDGKLFYERKARNFKE